MCKIGKSSYCFAPVHCRKQSLAIKAVGRSIKPCQGKKNKRQQLLQLNLTIVDIYITSSCLLGPAQSFLLRNVAAAFVGLSTFGSFRAGRHQETKSLGSTKGVLRTKSRKPVLKTFRSDLTRSLLYLKNELGPI